MNFFVLFWKAYLPWTLINTIVFSPCFLELNVTSQIDLEHLSWCLCFDGWVADWVFLSMEAKG
jgi:hypothetical protein